MAKVTVKAGEDYALRLSKLAGVQDSVAKKAVGRGAGILADAVRRNLENLQEDYHPGNRKSYWYLAEGEKYAGIPEQEKKDLLDHLGVTKVDVDKNGDYNAKIGFDGYDSQPTQKYPNGRPIPMLARAVESGSSVRQKQPFIAPAVRKTKKAAIAAMQEVIDEEYEKIMKRE